MNIEEELGQLESVHEGFQIVAGSNVTAEGSLRHGFAICSTCPQDQGTGSIPSGGGETTTGACCAEDGTCTVTTEAGCAGTWQGQGTDCDPNPCSQPTGACCHDDGSCFESTEGDCDGTWRGAGTNCFTFGVCFGACCHPNGLCDEKTADDCADDPGLTEFHGIGTDCDDFSCGGACCDCLGCNFYNHSLCDDVGGVWHEGEICDDVCPVGCCCQYLSGVFNSCAGTTESQCTSACCDPPCPDWTFVWHSDPTVCEGGCSGCPPTP